MTELVQRLEKASERAFIVLDYLRYSLLRRRKMRHLERAKRASDRLRTMSVERRHYARVKRAKKNLERRILRAGSRVLWIFPVRRRRIVLSAYAGRSFSCNSRAVSNYLTDNYPSQFEIYWSFRDPSKFVWLRDRGIDVVRYGSLKHAYISLTSSAYVSNARIPSSMKFRPEQMVVNLGHGGGAYKKLLLDNPSIRPDEATEIRESTANTTLFASSCASFTEHVVRGAFGHDGEVLEVGMPRNDCLYNASGEDVQRAKNSVAKYFGLPKGTRVALYAPTYRKGARSRIDHDFPFSDVLESLRDRFGGNWICLARSHYFSNVNFGSYSSVLDATDYLDMAELLLATDFFFTDYSSSVWDFALLDRPGLLFCPDADEYLSVQGTYTPLSEFPFEPCYSPSELLAGIEGYDLDESRRLATRHLQRLGSFESGEATSAIGTRIVEHLNH